MYNTIKIKIDFIDKEYNNKFPWLDNPYQLWSLEDMLKISATRYITIGQYLQQMAMMLKQASADDPPAIGLQSINELKKLISFLKTESDNLGLPISTPLLDKFAEELAIMNGGNASYLHGKISMLTQTIGQELRSQLFFYVPTYRAKYYDWDNILTPNFVKAFPEATIELGQAAKCFSLGRYTACVFHSMRAAELGLRTLAQHLEVDFPYDISLAQWNDIIKKIEKKIADQENIPKSAERDEELRFCSEAASQFRHFKNAYRIFVAHTRARYGESEAESIINKTREFLANLATKLTELKSSET